MKLEDLKSVELKAIEKPAVLELPKELEGKFTREEWKVFGHFCNKNPELPCMTEKVYLKNIALCIKATANGKLDDVIKDPMKMTSHPFYKKWQAYYQNIKDEKAELRKDPKIKEANKKRSEERKAKYGTALVNGVEEPLQSFILEPEGIYQGRPGSPDTGLWKEATKLEEVVVNSAGKCPKLIVDDKEMDYDFEMSFDPKAHYAAAYPIRIGVPGKKPTIQHMGHIMFGANSSVKKEGQAKKYDAADNLMKESANLIKDLLDGLRKDPTSTKVAIYCLFFKGIRIGHKTETRNGTKGLLTLEWGKDVTRVGNKIHFDFYGKDSVHDVSDLECDKDIADAIESVWSKDGKLKTDKTKIEAWVKTRANIVFTPKLSRTMVAAKVMTDALAAVEQKYNLNAFSPVPLKKLAFQEANMAVAHQLNHQKGVSKAAEAKRQAKFAETKDKLKEREAKAKELTKKRQAKIKELKKAKKEGWQEKVAKLEEMIAKSAFRTDIAEKNANFKEAEANFTASTSKASYIDPAIISDWCKKIALPLDKVYSKTQLNQFNDLITKED